MRNLCVIVLITISSLAYSQVSLDSIMREKMIFKEEFTFNEEFLVKIPETSIQIMPPEHFIFSEQVPGFIHIGTSATIQITEIKGTSYVMLKNGLTEKNLKDQNVQLLNNYEIEMLDGTPGHLFQVEFTSNNIKYLRYILLAGDYHNTMWISGSYAYRAKEIIEDILLQSMLTAKFTD
jgi:hypothetical protein